MLESRLYNSKICLNVLAGSVENARAIYEQTEGHVLIGLLSSNYQTVDAAVADFRQYAHAVGGAISVGLGAGNPAQWKMVADIASMLDVCHVNQVFTAAGYTRARAKSKETFINCLVNPAEEVGFVNIATGPVSSSGPAVNVPIETAITLIREMGCNSLKLFPLNGLDTRTQYRAIAEACGKAGFPLEPTGGIDLNNFADIVTIALESDVPAVIPHVYSSIIDQSTGQTRIDDVKKLYEIMRKLG